MSGLLKELSVFGSDNIKLNINSEVFKKFVEFCQINEFRNDLNIMQIKTNDLKLALAGQDKNYEFITQFRGLDGTTVSNTDQRMITLFHAAEYLRCQSLVKLIASVVACTIYFEDNNEAYQKKKKQLGVVDEITFREDEEYMRTYYLIQ